MVDDDDIPNCFGDESEYDPDHDRHCKVCDIRDACGAEVRSARKKRIRDRALGRPTSTMTPPSPSREAAQSHLLPRRRFGREEPTSRGETPVVRRDVSFWTALGHNTVLETMSAILREFWYSVTQIPRLEYRSPWDMYEDSERDQKK